MTLRRTLSLVIGCALVAPFPAPAAADTPGVYCLGRRATLVGTPGDDHLVSRESGEIVAGLEGNDVLIALHSDVDLCGGVGGDALNGTMDAAGRTRLDGGPGSDRLTKGNAHYGRSSSSIVVDMTAGTVTGSGTDILEEVFEVRGTRYADTFVSGLGDPSEILLLYGAAGDDEMSGGVSPDVLKGGPGDDSIFGGAGPDVVAGGSGDDLLDGGGDRDEVTYEGSPNPVAASLADGRAVGHGVDELDGFEWLRGSPRADHLEGDDEANALFGLGGDDVIEAGGGWDGVMGHGGRDRLLGQGGGDVLRGYAGEDRLFGGTGPDSSYGGPGRDVCSSEDRRSCP